MMHLIGVLIIGFIAGLLARALHPGDDKMGVAMTTILGISGAFLGNFIGQTLLYYSPEHGASFIAAVIGAVVLLLVFSTARRMMK